MGASSSSPSPARHERFGSFVLLAETDRSWLANEHRAAHLGESGFDRLVQLVRFEPACAPAAPDALVEHVRAAAKAGPGVLRPLGTGRAGTPWLSYEHHGGRSLRAVLARGREEGFPLSLDNALEVARQVSLTLEKVHARKLSNGEPLVHGYLAPWSVIVSFDGAVRLRGFGLWAGRALGGLPPEEAGTLAPEQANGHADPRTDVYGLGALVLEALRQAPLPGGVDLRTLVAETTAPEDEALPEALKATLERALSPRPEARHQGAAEFRRELEALLFAGDVAPTTFNLAFFMETLYRGVVEADARAIDEETHADYTPYFRSATGEKTAAPAPVEKAAPPAPPEPPPVLTAAAAPEVTPEPLPKLVTMPAAPPPAVERHAPAPPERAAVPGGRAAKAVAPNRTPVIAAGVVALLLVGGGAFYLLKLRRPAASSAPAPTTLSAEAQAAMVRVQELEARLKTLEEERVQAEAAAVEQASQRVQAEAKARGQAVDARAVERAKEEAARKVRLEEEKRQQEERNRLEQQKREEEARLAAAAAAALTPATTLPPVTMAAAPEPPPTLVAEASPEPAASTEAPPASGVYDFNSPGVVPPVLVSEQRLEYPPVARQARITGSVTVAAVVTEQGRVEAARATSGNPVLRKAAVDHVTARRYRPAQKDGVPVKIQMIILVNFKG
jgi:TonB family protein